MKNFNMNFFKQQIPYGQVVFDIKTAIIKNINTKNGEQPIIEMKIKLIDQTTGKSDILENYYLFIDDNRKSIFGQFCAEYCNKLDSNGFNSGADLIGLTGNVHYDLNDKNYETLSSWSIDIPSDNANQQLAEHAQQNASINQTQNVSFNKNHNIFDNFNASANTDAPVIENSSYNDTYYTEDNNHA